MPIPMTSRSGRIVITGLIVLGCLASFITLGVIAHGGAMSGEAIQETQTYLLQFYAPLFGVVAGFYFAERKPTRSIAAAASPMEAFLLGGVIIAVWAALPALTLAISDTYNAAIRTLDSVKLYGSA